MVKEFDYMPLVENGKKNEVPKRFYKVKYKWEASMEPVTEIFLAEKLSDIIDYLHEVEGSELVEWRNACCGDFSEVPWICEL